MRPANFWFRISFALQVLCIAPATTPTVEDRKFAVLALAAKDHKPQSHLGKQQELAVKAGDVLWVRRNISDTWAFARNKTGGKGRVPLSVLSLAQPAAVTADVAGSSVDQPQPQLSAKLGDAVWLTQRHQGQWSWALGDGGEGWLPDWVLKLPEDKTLQHATAATVSKHFAANSQALHHQLSVNNGEMVLVAGQLVTDIWVFAMNMREHRGWVPGGTLQSLVAAIVLQTFDVGGAPGGPEKQISVVEGHTVWVSNRFDSGWVFVRTQGREGWIPTGALVGNGNFVSAARVPVAVLVVGIVALILTACMIAAFVFWQRTQAASDADSRSLAVPERAPESAPESVPEPRPYIAPRRNKNPGLYGGLDAMSYREPGASFQEGKGQSNCRRTFSFITKKAPNKEAVYLEVDNNPKSQSFAGEQVTYFM